VSCIFYDVKNLEGGVNRSEQIYAILGDGGGGGGEWGLSADSWIVSNRRMDLVPGYESLMDPGGSRGRTHSGDRVVILPRRNSQEQVGTIPIPRRRSALRGDSPKTVNISNGCGPVKSVIMNYGSETFCGHLKKNVG
jgi:hypothetical protein